MIAFAFAGSLVARVIRGEQVSEKVNITLAFVSNYCTIKYTSFNSSLVSNFTVAYDSSIVNMNDNSGWTYYPDIAMMAAVEHANNDPTILPGIHVNIKRFTDCGPYDANAAENYYGNSGGYAGSITAQDLAEVHTDVIGVISNEYSSTTRGIAEILSEYKIPMCGTISGSTRFSNKIIYPYYWRVMNVNFSQELLLILDYWNVNDVCVVYQQDSDFSLSL
ncbi:hypothetical protein BC830DRAFT_198780 [Chytriomyces sp. MP71]|nr:hypothetical protein BC830DRAFT_198780 [Chytriomyces sp. MP71]